MRDRIEGDIRLYKLVIGIGIILGIGFKLVLMIFFSSDYQNKMFIPFAGCFVKHSLNPYEYYYLHNQIPSFPYPPMLLWIESIGVLLIETLHITSNLAINFVFKMPLLLADLVMFFFLQKICKYKTGYILLFYFYSPIILYSTYMHGQLDIIPMTFLIIAIYYLSKGDNYSIFVFVCGITCAVTCKLHILAVVPLLFYFLYKRRGVSVTLISGLGMLAGILMIILPFWGDGFIHLVLFAKEQEGLYNVSFDYGDVKVYLSILAICFIYLKIIQLKRISKDLCLCFAGIIYSVFLICVSPMPGWFVWIVPFVSIYFCKNQNNRNRVSVQYMLLHIVYCIYFFFFHDTSYVDLYFENQSLDFWKIHNENCCNLCFTLLVAILLMLVYLMYRFGINANKIYKRDGLPFTIGIAGDSGTGKTELLSNIESLIDAKRILYIEGDGDHRWERGSNNWEQYTHLDPRANYLYRQANDIQKLRNGNSIKRVEYNHDTGRFTNKHRINPKPFIIMCGLHSLYLPQMRKVLDLKIYLDTDEKLRRYWKIIRDTGKRGYTNEQIIAQIEKRIPDAQEYIYPQAAYADLVISYFDATLNDCFEVNHKLVLSLKITTKSSWNFDFLIHEFKKIGFQLEHTYEEDLKHQNIIFDGQDIEKYDVDFEEIIKRNFDNYRDIFTNELQWKSKIDGIVQLFIAFAICEEMEGE